MGTYLYVNAADQVLEEIAGVEAGMAARIREIETAYSTAQRTVPLDDPDDLGMEAFTLHEAALNALGPRARSLAALLGDGGLGKLQSWREVQAAGLDPGCGELAYDPAGDNALILQILRLQRRRWGRRGGIRMGPAEFRPEYAIENREQRANCWRAMEAVRAGKVQGVGWG